MSLIACLSLFRSELLIGFAISYLSNTAAAKDQLAFVNSAGNAIIKVDNTSTVTFNQKRNSIRITTKDHFTVGSLWISDMTHVPYGVSFQRC